MKGLIHICMIFVALIPSVSKAQVGLKGGLGVSDIIFAVNGQTPYLGYEIDYMEHRNPSVSFQLGSFYTIQMGKRMHVQPELLLARQGLDYDIAFLYDNITYRIRIDYLQFPLLVYYKTAPGKKFHPGLFAGPYGSVRLNAVRIIEMEGSREESGFESVKQTDFGITGGLSLDYNLPAGQLICEIRTNYGLLNMMNHLEGYIPSYYGPEREYARNISITFLAGYRFSKAKI